MSRARDIADEALVALAKAKQAQWSAERARESSPPDSPYVREMHDYAQALFIEANVLAIAAQIEALGD